MLAVLLCVCSASVWATDPSPAATSATSAKASSTAPASSASSAKTSSAPAAGAKAQEFARLSKDFNAMIAELTALQGEYAATTSAAKKEAIAGKFNAEKERADKLANQLVNAAHAAYIEAPNADVEVTRILTGTLANQIERDDYEAAFALGKLLMDNKCPDPLVPAWPASPPSARTSTIWPPHG